MVTRQRVHEMVQGGFARARPQVHGPHSTNTPTKGQSLPRCWVTTKGTLAVQKVLFRFHLLDVPRCRPCSCSFPNNVVDKPRPVSLTPLPLRWTLTVFLNAVKNELHSVQRSPKHKTLSRTYRFYSQTFFFVPFVLTVIFTCLDDIELAIFVMPRNREYLQLRILALSTLCLCA